MHDYELVALISPQVGDEDVPKVAERVRTFITDRGGKVAEVKPWGRRRLAYHIGNFQEANYLLFLFSMDPKHARELEESLRLAEDVIRHQLVVAEPPAPPQPEKKAPAAAAAAPSAGS
jgi:small subunit ribosomal protein S6